MSYQVFSWTGGGAMSAQVPILPGSDPNNPLSQLWMVVGSGFAPAAALIGVMLTISDASGNSVGTVEATVFTNEGQSHKAFVPATVVTALPAGTYTVTLTALAGTIIDGNDHFSLTLGEFEHSGMGGR